MITSIIAATGQFVYAQIPREELRRFVDNIFPQLAKFPEIDKAGKDVFFHRYAAGHDLLLDVPKTFVKDGFSKGMRHLGHILMTDFPTKQGIPFPLFSQSGIGHLCQEWGLKKIEWLHCNICDAGVGILAIAEGHSDLAAAIAGNMGMSVETFFDTFIEGAIELVTGFHYKNPLLLIGGAENILAGVVSATKELSCYINPLDFFSGAFISAAIGFTISSCLLKSDLVTSIKNAGRSGLLGSLFTVSPFFAYGTMLGFASYEYGKALANKRNKQIATCYKISYKAVLQFFKDITVWDSDFLKFYENSSIVSIQSECQKNNIHIKTFDKPANKVLESKQSMLNTRPTNDLKTDDFIFSTNTNNSLETFWHDLLLSSATETFDIVQE